MDLKRLSEAFGYEHDGQHIVLPFRVGEPRGSVKHPVGFGGKLTVPETGYVAGMILDQ